VDINFLGIGLPEVLVILIITLIVVGPERLPAAAAQIGKMVRQIRQYAAEVTYQFREELDALTQEYEAMQQELKRTQEELRLVQEQIKSDVQALGEDIEEARKDIAQVLDSAVAPPSNGQGEPTQLDSSEAARVAQQGEAERLSTSFPGGTE